MNIIYAIQRLKKIFISDVIFRILHYYPRIILFLLNVHDENYKKRRGIFARDIYNGLFAVGGYRYAYRARARPGAWA